MIFKIVKDNGEYEYWDSSIYNNLFVIDNNPDNINKIFDIISKQALAANYNVIKIQVEDKLPSFNCKTPTIVMIEDDITRRSLAFVGQLLVKVAETRKYLYVVLTTKKVNTFEISDHFKTIKF